MQSASLIDKTLLKFLALGVLGFALANIVNQLLGSPFWFISRSIHLGFDDNIPAWYSSILLFVAALTALECFHVGKAFHISGTWTFLVFGGLLAVLSCDEIARFHERIGALVGKALGLHSLDWVHHTPWLLIGAPLALGVFSVVYLLLKKTLELVPGSLVALGGGILCIILGGIVLESTINWLNHEELQWVWEAEIILEESLEMIGTLGIAFGLAKWRDGLRYHFQSRQIPVPLMDTEMQPQVP